MGLPKNPHPVRAGVVPVTNINQYIRVQGHPPYPLGRALQEWDGVHVEARWVREIGDKDSHLVREVLFTTEEGEFKIRVSEQIFEVALYTRASKRFGDWMKANKDKVSQSA